MLRPFVVLFPSVVVAACGASAASEGRDAGGPDASVTAGFDAAMDEAMDASAAPLPILAADGDVTPGADADADASEATAKGPLVAYVGGYGGVIGAYAVDETSGALTTLATVASFGASPSFLAIDPDAGHLYAVDEADDGQVGAYAIDATGTPAFLSAVPSGGSGPAFVGLDRAARYVFVANYNDGAIRVLPIESDGTLGAATDTRVAGANAHMMIADPSNRYVFVPCLGSDFVAQYVFDAAHGTLMPNPAAATFATAKGAGPRHLAFHPNGKYAYLVDETASTLMALSLDTSQGTLSALQTISTRVANGVDAGKNTGAEVAIAPSGNWVIASNRGDDSLAVFAVDDATGRLTHAETTASGGATPRSFAFTPEGSFVLSANQGSGNVVPFAFDDRAGALTAANHGVSFASASFVGFVRLPKP